MCAYKIGVQRPKAVGDCDKMGVHFRRPFSSMAPEVRHPRDTESSRSATNGAAAQVRQSEARVCKSPTLEAILPALLALVSGFSAEHVAWIPPPVPSRQAVESARCSVCGFHPTRWVDGLTDKNLVADLIGRVQSRGAA